MTSFLCKTCGTQFPESDRPPSGCPICEDERQYVPAEGQQWTTHDEVRAAHRADIRDEQPGLTGIGMLPAFGIGQRALLLESPSGNVLWDCLPLLDETAAFVESRGGLRAIAISHPHYFTTMVEWAHRFECRVIVHELDRLWVMRPDDSIEYWNGEAYALWDDVTLLKLGGHFAGGQVLHWAAGDALLSGDIVQVIPDRKFVTFMRSYPNMIPMSAPAVERIGKLLAPYPFDVIHGAWFDRLIPRDAKGIVERSIVRYVKAVSGDGSAELQ